MPETPPPMGASPNVPTQLNTKALLASNVVMFAMLVRCAKQFAKYAAHHHAKGTEESAAKGVANDELVQMIQAVLVGSPVPPWTLADTVWLPGAPDARFADLGELPIDPGEIATVVGSRALPPFSVWRPDDSPNLLAFTTYEMAEAARCWHLAQEELEAAEEEGLPTRPPETPEATPE